MAKRRVSFFGALWESFLVTYGPITAGVGVVLAILAWRLGAKSDVRVPLWGVTSLAILGLVIVWTLGQALRMTLRQLTGFESLRVVKVIPAKPPLPNCHLAFLVEPKTAVTVGSSVSVVRYENNLETPIGAGAVRWYQEEDGRVHVTLEELYIDAQDAFLIDLKGRKDDAVNQLRIRIGHTPRIEPFAVKRDSEMSVPNGERDEEAEA